MDGLEQSFREHFQANNAFNSLSPKKFEKAALQITDSIEKAITADLLSRAPKMLAPSPKGT